MQEDTLVCASTPAIRNAEKIGLYGFIERNLSCRMFYNRYGNHAYTILGTMEDKDQGKPKLVKVRNPWGEEKKEWKGAWSKNSKELDR